MRNVVAEMLAVQAEANDARRRITINKGTAALSAAGRDLRLANSKMSTLARKATSAELSEFARRRVSL